MQENIISALRQHISAERNDNFESKLLIMQELIQTIADKAGITTEQAAIALQTVQEYWDKNKSQSPKDEKGFMDSLKEKAEELLAKAKDSKLAEKAGEIIENLKKKI